MTNKRVAIVTASSRGIGAACARALHESEYKLVLMSRSDDIFPLANELDARPLQGSVDSDEDLNRLVNFTFEKYGRIDAVICNTGHPPKGELLDLNDDDWVEGMNLVLLNVIRICKYVTPIMSKSGGGSIVTISSFSAKEPSLKFPVSSVMRTALSSFTKMYANQYGQLGIRINNILPGYIDSYPVDAVVLEDIPLKRQGSPKDIANLASFLVSEHSKYITGQDLLVDGGLVKSI